MDIKIGKIYNYNKTTGVGYIITKDSSYMFTINDVEFPLEEIENGILVKFKGERIYKVNKAFFVKLLQNEKKSTK